MNLWVFFITNSKPPILVQPRYGTLNNPTIYSQTTAVFGSTFCQNRLNAFMTKFSAMRFRIVPSVSKYTIRFATRASRFAGYRRNTINQWQQLCNIVPVRSGQFNCQRNPISVSYQMMFRAFFAAIRWVWACLAPQKRLAPKMNQQWPERNLSGLLGATCSVEYGVFCPICRLFASLAIFSSRSFHSRNPFPLAGLPIQCRF